MPSDSSQLPQSTVEWLSLIRYQLMLASEQSILGQPLSALALNSMQDAVESALALVVQTQGATLGNRADFLQIFDSAVQHGSDTHALAAFRPAMQAMNNARVSFKHHGNVPDQSIVTRHFVQSESFVTNLVRDVFQVDLSEISLLVFIKSAGARDLLNLAQEKWNDADANAAMEALRLAFDDIVRDYTERKQWHPGRSLFTTKPSSYPSIFDVRKLGKPVEKIDEWLQNLDKWVKYVALGIDMRGFAYFDAHAPSVVYAIGGNHFSHPRQGVEVTADVFTRCFKFVVDTGIALARDDFDLDLWAARQAARSSEADSL